ncbi:MAG: uracil-DNA glycosylase [Firmicutes bacterium]|nr:uracil-DNA glycosylase [Bacillota bacterium]
MVKLNNSWDELLAQEFQKEYYLKLREFLKNEYKNQTVYPDMHDIFSALKVTDYKDVRVVILGQDPYHEPGEAHGMAFSVKPGVKVPPSLINIFKEIRDDLGIELPEKGVGYLMPWAEQGVLLLNTCLTVRAHQANSHSGKGWEQFTDRVIELLTLREEPMVFILWGRNARSKMPLIAESNKDRKNKHLILEGAHPSPFSAYNGFFGGKYFSKTNEYLKAKGFDEIDWNLKGKD